jgi:hypothetical protein
MKISGSNYLCVFVFAIFSIGFSFFGCQIDGDNNGKSASEQVEELLKGSDPVTFGGGASLEIDNNDHMIFEYGGQFYTGSYEITDTKIIITIGTSTLTIEYTISSDNTLVIIKIILPDGTIINVELTSDGNNDNNAPKKIIVTGITEGEGTDGYVVVMATQNQDSTVAKGTAQITGSNLEVSLKSAVFSDGYDNTENWTGNGFHYVAIVITGDFYFTQSPININSTNVTIPFTDFTRVP